MPRPLTAEEVAQVAAENKKKRQERELKKQAELNRRLSQIATPPKPKKEKKRKKEIKPWNE